jgi:hypothetical protein
MPIERGTAALRRPSFIRCSYRVADVARRNRENKQTNARKKEPRSEKKRDPTSDHLPYSLERAERRSSAVLRDWLQRPLSTSAPGLDPPLPHLHRSRPFEVGVQECTDRPWPVRCVCARGRACVRACVCGGGGELGVCGLLSGGIVILEHE